MMTSSIPISQPADTSDTARALRLLQVTARYLGLTQGPHCAPHGAPCLDSGKLIRDAPAPGSNFNDPNEPRACGFPLPTLVDAD